MRRAGKIDDNQTAIVNALRAHGASVSITSAVGQGFPDLCIGFGGRTFILELKDGSKSPSRRRLTPDQVKFKNAWQGQYAVVETIEQAIAAITKEM